MRAVTLAASYLCGLVGLFLLLPFLLALAEHRPDIAAGMFGLICLLAAASIGLLMMRRAL